MLKRLDLLGFKSFADKTAFEFGSGITCIVGPNGSGKSNVVDAIKWVLGEQSAKSLRGKEMADVIFNGSATRRSLGFAEATLVFDNSHRLLPVESHEVQLTRRVYRSGEGEYLINKNPARLRDFRELFMGTGAGTEAYSVIEQGKVDVLLQASTKDRRLIFEEAAGISRFRARKIEAMRKFEAVDQNLLRLQDIVEEVEKQLRSVKLQAAKARRYKEHSETLRDLRLKTGLADLHTLTIQLEATEEQARSLSHEVSQRASQCDVAEAKVVQLQALDEEVDGQIRGLESSLADCRQELTRLESQINYERAHVRDLSVQIDRLRRQAAEYVARVSELQAHITSIQREVTEVEENAASQRSLVEQEETELETLRALAESKRERMSREQAGLIDCIQSGNDLHNELASLGSRENSLRAQRQRLASRCDALAVPLVELREHLATLSADETSTARNRDQLSEQLNELDGQLEELWLVQQQTSSSQAELRAEHSATVARMELLEDLEKRREGVAGGVQELLAQPSFAANAVGLIADLLIVDLPHASVIEYALGDRSQELVVRRQGDVIQSLGQSDQRPEGRASIVSLDALRPVPVGQANDENIERHPGFVARAVSLVKPVEGLEALIWHLLGHSIIVKDLAAALEIAPRVAPSFRFVTEAGDILEPDGTLTTGKSFESAGLLSRKSQLRALQQEAQSQDAQLEAGERELEAMVHKQTLLKSEQAVFEGQLTEAADQALRLSTLLGQRRQQLADLEEELRSHQAEVGTVDRELDSIEAQRQDIHARMVHVTREQDAIEQAIRQLDSEIEHDLSEVEQRRSELTTSKVELAMTEGQLGGLRQRLGSLCGEMEDRRRVCQDTQSQLEAARTRERSCQRNILTSSSRCAELFLRKEQLCREIAALSRRRDSLREQRQSLGHETQASRAALQEIQAELHNRHLETTEKRHQRAALVERIREDYEVDLTSLYPGYQPDPTLDRQAVQQEIQELRRKIAVMGNVNMEALTELQELETRATTLHAQIADLNQSKATLTEIIDKINQDSRRMFLETLDSIRGHFGELFRKLFGGGRADILLEDEADVLESGIEIVARPPGKELRSLSLLSGGEKTLTTVALLMAVFRSKPSPFCILDEVDAALDEANVERYTTLLREFSQQAQFIMITHSKKSMVCADVLYGITMQESGVSKRVSVRFEDVNEQGEISQDALARSQENTTSPPDQEAA